MSHLINAISSDYMDASQRLRGSRTRLVRVYVEGYDDIAFWRDLLDEFETDTLKFEISVPVRNDLAKGKKVVLKMVGESGKSLILCVDSDFDYLFGDHTEQSRMVNKLPYIFHTYAYSIENLICYAGGLHRVCVKATKNDAQVFDFESFMQEYSRIIYPLFLWYALSARRGSETVFPLLDFRNSVRINYLDIREDGLYTLNWLKGQVSRKLQGLEEHYPDMLRELAEFRAELTPCGVTPENVYLFIQGHTLLDNVVVVVLKRVCDELRDMALKVIHESDRRGVSLRNELSNYNNSLRDVREILCASSHYKPCSLYGKIHADLERYVASL